MKLSIQYKEFSKIIDCPKNTFIIGVKIKGNIVVSNVLHFVFENVECTKHDIKLPDGTKIKFYFYTCDHPEIIKLQQNAIFSTLKITGKNYVIEAFKKQPS